jgi:hypothetical protein
VSGRLEIIVGLPAVKANPMDSVRFARHWFMYFLMVFVVITLLTEINYLNKALELFNTSMGRCGRFRLGIVRNSCSPIRHLSSVTPTYVMASLRRLHTADK